MEMCINVDLHDDQGKILSFEFSPSSGTLSVDILSDGETSSSNFVLDNPNVISSLGEFFKSASEYAGQI
tara:strand:- start:1346 stop:1552 length:207 start_codon:yes stop_codon:yes gene_type:complete